MKDLTLACWLGSLTLAWLFQARKAFEDWWLSANAEKRPNPTGYSQIRMLAKQAFPMSCPLPIKFDLLPMHVLNMLYSAKHGRVVGWKFKSFIEVAHRIASGYREHLLLFRAALKAYQCSDQIRKEDRSGKWQVKAELYKEQIRNGDQRYIRNQEFDALVKFLFPEIAQPISTEI